MPWLRTPGKATWRRASARERRACLDLRRALDRDLPRHRADLEHPVRDDALELGKPVEIDEDARHREAQVHERYEALAAGQDLGLVAVLAQNLDRLVEAFGGEVLERRGLHEL